MAQITISDELNQQLEKIVSESQEFSDVSAYASYILQQVVEKKMGAQSKSESQDKVYSKEDEDKIRARLKNLGYLD